MKRKAIQLSLILFLGAVSVQAQTDSFDEGKDKEAIRKKIDGYFEGWMTGDTTKIGNSMHTTCKLKNIKDGKVVVFDRATYLGFFKPRARRVNSEGRIVDIDITGDIAAAKCQIETTKQLFTDYFNLMKVDGEWFIVDKIATRRAKD